LDSYKEINPSLVHILHFRLMNTGVLVGIIKLLILIIRRTYHMMSMSHYNPYINEMMGEGVMVALSYHFHSNTDPILQSRIQLLRHSIESNGTNLANDDAEMPEPNPRRIVEGKNDGDVRFIEEAMNSMGL
jgi:hypothetical protein